MRWLVSTLCLWSAVAHAEPSDGDVKKAIFRLTTAYQCGPILKDLAPYAWAKKEASRLVGDKKSVEMIAYVEAQSREGSPLNEKSCRNMTKNFHD